MTEKLKNEFLDTTIAKIENNEKKLEVKRIDDEPAPKIEGSEQRHKDEKEAEKIRRSLAPEQKPVAELLYKPIKEEDRLVLEKEIQQLKKETKFQAPALFKGNQTATEYDSRVGNFSTQTKIATLPSGRKLFLINNYGSSWIHRELDSLMKFFTGCKMRKAKSKKWKKQFESKSRIPTIPTEEENLVILDYIPNINIYDLFANRDQISNWGKCEFAANTTTESLMEVVDKIVDRVKEVHNENVAWGELILPNIIIDKDKQVHICDPEVSYYEDVPFLEQKARDLLDLIISIAAVMKQKNNKDYGETIPRIIERYGDQEVLAELKKLAAKKSSFLNRLFFGYTKERLGLKNHQEMADIKKEIAGAIE